MDLAAYPQFDVEECPPPAKVAAKFEGHAMKKTITLITAATLLSASPALADPTFGLGLTFSFGGGQPDVGVGVRVFSDDREDEFAGSLGLDYMFGSESWRGSLGAAYMMDNSYIELNSGYNFGSRTFDVGIGGGFAKTQNQAIQVVEETTDEDPEPTPTPQAECEASGGFWTGNSCV
jgi:hypothetical protein